MSSYCSLAKAAGRKSVKNAANKYIINPAQEALNKYIIDPIKQAYSSLSSGLNNLVGTVMSNVNRIGRTVGDVVRGGINLVNAGIDTASRTAQQIMNHEKTQQLMNTFARIQAALCEAGKMDLGEIVRSGIQRGTEKVKQLGQDLSNFGKDFKQDFVQGIKDTGKLAEKVGKGVALTGAEMGINITTLLSYPAEYSTLTLLEGYRLVTGDQSVLETMENIPGAYEEIRMQLAIDKVKVAQWAGATEWMYDPEYTEMPWYCQVGTGACHWYRLPEADATERAYIITNTALEVITLHSLAKLAIKGGTGTKNLLKGEGNLGAKVNFYVTPEGTVIPAETFVKYPGLSAEAWDAMSAVNKFVGSDAKVIYTSKGNLQIMSADGSRIVRFDLQGYSDAHVNAEYFIKDEYGNIIEHSNAHIEPRK